MPMSPRGEISSVVPARCSRSQGPGASLGSRVPRVTGAGPEGRVPEGGLSVYEHEVICRVLEAMPTVDQLNAGALMSAELLARRLQLIEDARRGCPSNPRYSASGAYMVHGAHH